MNTYLMDIYVELPGYLTDDGREEVMDWAMGQVSGCLLGEGLQVSRNSNYICVCIESANSSKARSEIQRILVDGGSKFVPCTRDIEFGGVA